MVTLNGEKRAVAIIGAGPAGMAVALQLQRYQIDFFLFDSDGTGSLLKNAWSVANYLGIYPEKTGQRLLLQFQNNLVQNKIRKINSYATTLDYNFKTRLFEIRTKARTYKASYVAVATGTKPKILKQQLPKTCIPYLFYEVFPLLKKRNQTILIVGAGDAAFDMALSLAQANQVIICNRDNKITALPLLVRLVLANPNVTYFAEYKLKKICHLTASKNLRLLFVSRQKKVYIEADYLLTAIGRLPQKDFYTKRLGLVEKKLILSQRLFLVGDVKNQIYRQVAIAVGDGIKAAMTIFHNLVRNDSKHH